MVDKLVIQFSDGNKYSIPASVIAEHRAYYFAEKELNMQNYYKIFVEEFVYTLNNHDKVEDWAFNNMDWCDIKKHAKFIETNQNADYEKEWSNSGLYFTTDSGRRVMLV